MVSYVSYNTMEVSVNVKANGYISDIEMVSNATSMSEIVVVANSLAIDRKTPVAVSTITAATIEEKVPGWMKNTGKGWVTAEYGMLPRSTHQRMDREAAKGKQSGRTQEIQRLIGRSLRAVVDLKKLGEQEKKLDGELKTLILPSHANEGKDIIIEIRPATGGDEAGTGLDAGASPAWCAIYIK